MGSTARTCTACSAAVPDEASSCPNCGAPTPTGLVGAEAEHLQAADREVLNRFARSLERHGSSGWFRHLAGDDLNRVVDLWDNAVDRFLVKRYGCGSAGLEYLHRRWASYALDSSKPGPGPCFTDEGEAILPPYLRREIDAWAAEIGLNPSIPDQTRPDHMPRSDPGR